MNTIIRNGTVVTANETFRADLRITKGVIAEIGTSLKPAAGEEVIDAADRLVLPGGVDVHTHLDMPFMGTVTSDDFETGTTAAAVGGTTTIVDFVIPGRDQPLSEALDVWQERARGKAVVDYGFHMALVEFNDSVAAGMAEMVAKGVTSFKCFLAYKGALMVEDGEFLAALATAREQKALVQVHAENGEMLVWLTERLRAAGKLAACHHEEAHPILAEGESTNRAIALARAADQPLYVVHLSCGDALDSVRLARALGQEVYCETCPQYLLLDSSRYHEGGFEAAKWVMSPPLREAGNGEELWAGLRDGSIQVVATDHCSFNFEGQKDLGRDDFTKIPNGAPGVGDRMNLLWTAGVQAGRITPNRFVALTATNPARLFGLAPRKGSIAVGADADLVIFDHNKKGVVSVKTSKHRCDYSAFEGFALEGMPELVLSRGEVIARDGEYTGRPGRGEFLPRAPFCGE
jgi:dihydropyrimidinase